MKTETRKRHIEKAQKRLNSLRPRWEKALGELQLAQCVLETGDVVRKQPDLCVRGCCVEVKGWDGKVVDVYGELGVVVVDGNADKKIVNFRDVQLIREHS